MRLQRHIGRHVSARGYVFNTHWVLRFWNSNLSHSGSGNNRDAVTVSDHFQLLKDTLQYTVTREICLLRWLRMLLTFWTGPEQGRVHARQESCRGQPCNPVDQYAFRALILRPELEAW